MDAVSSTLFSAKDYRAFLRGIIEENRGTRGYQSRLAEAAGVHTSYVSRVVSGHLQLTLDQAANLAEFWHMETDEADYFLDLVLLERSASPSLKARVSARLERARRSREKLDQRFSRASSLETENLEAYYSAWYFSAIHMLLTIPKFRRPPEIARKLRLPDTLVRSALQTLSDLGLASLVDGQWRPGAKDLHIGESAIWARVHHGHWRQQTGLRIQEAHSDDLHYSGVHTMSLEDARKLKQMLVQVLDRGRKLIAPSPEEELYFLGCDFYGF